jgi:hypothetical protein
MAMARQRRERGYGRISIKQKRGEIGMELEIRHLGMEFKDVSD